jgi:phosphotriesterase-related protein
MDKKIIEKSQKGKVQTVIGLVDSDKLGFALMHEHLLSDMSAMIPKPIRFLFKKMVNNMMKTNLDDAIHEAVLFKKVGGNTIVDVSPRHLRCDTQALVRIAKEAGINVIMGTAYYIHPTLPKDMDSKTVEGIAKE